MCVSGTMGLLAPGAGTTSRSIAVSIPKPASLSARVLSWLASDMDDALILPPKEPEKSSESAKATPDGNDNGRGRFP